MIKFQIIVIIYNMNNDTQMYNHSFKTYNYNNVDKLILSVKNTS